MILGSNAEGEKRLITRERFIPLLLNRYKVYSISIVIMERDIHR